MADSETFDFDRLLTHSEWLTSLARRLVTSPAADDVVQDTWLAALRNPPREVLSPRAWLSRVARRLARVQEPWRHAKPAPSSREDCPPTDEVVARIEQERLLARLVVELEEPYRTVVLQRFYGGLTAARIASVAGIPAATVRTRLRRALAILRERLEREHGCDRRGWPLASLFLVPEADTLVTVGKGALLMGIKTKVALSVASGAVCALAVTEGILPSLEERTLEDPVSITSAAQKTVAPATEPGQPKGIGVPLESATASAPPSARQAIEWHVSGATSLEDLRGRLLSSDRIEQVRAIELLVAKGSADASQVLLDAFATTSDPVLLALVDEALLEPALNVAPAVMKASLASDDAMVIGRLSGLLARLAKARPELQKEVVGHFLAALENSDESPERAGAATGALASLGAAALDGLADYLVERESGPKGVGSVAWLIANMPEQYGDAVRDKLADGLRGSLDVLGESNLSEAEREVVLQKTGSLAWSTSLRPEQEHDALSEVLLENLLAAKDPAQAGSLAWGLGNLKGMTERSRIGTTRSLLNALNDQTDVGLCHQYLSTIQRLAVEQPVGPSFDALMHLIEDARAVQPKDGKLAPRLDRLAAELRAHAEKAAR